jgi:hypothetical protein
VLVESCDEAIGKENDHLMIKVKRLELKVNKLKKQVKVQPSQDNHRNIVKKLENGTTASKITSQHQNKSIHYKKEEKNSMDEKIEHARSAYLNVRRPHIRN